MRTVDSPAGGRGPASSVLDPESLERLRTAAGSGTAAVVRAAGELLRAVAGKRPALVVKPGANGWIAAAGNQPRSALYDRVVGTSVLPGRTPWADVDGGLTMVPVRPGALVFALDGVLATDDPLLTEVQLLAAAVDLALLAGEQAGAADKVSSELSALEKVAGEILSVRDIGQVLLSIAYKVLNLLDADMAGVLLVEGDELVMRSCVGNRSVESARLRVRRGQGLAGRVLQTGQPHKVDAYLASDEITHDFDPLARVESTRAALAAPLAVHGEVVGVLEVWRRRRSRFNDADVRWLLALANLAMIAIENARLYDAQQASLRHLAVAQSSLKKQLDALQQSADLQQELVALLLEGEGLQAIARAIATRLDARALVFSPELEVLAAYPRGAEAAVPKNELRRLSRLASDGRGPVSTALEGESGWLVVQAVHAADNPVGWFCIVTDTPPDTTVDIAVSEAAVYAALIQLQERASEQTHAEMRDEILWDLLEGSHEHRQAAVTRAARYRVDLSTAHRVVVGKLEGLDDVIRVEGWDTTRIERLRRELRSLVQRLVGEHTGAELASLRADTIAAVVPLAAPEAAKSLVRAIDGGIGRVVPGLRCVWGVSAPESSPLELHTAHHEARVAVKAARRLGGERITLFDELGVVRLLLVGDEHADLDQFVNDTIGPLVEHDRAKSSELLATLRAYFESDCAQQPAARRLSVHHKTLRYRLQRIQELTGLDLRRHEDRLRADIALKVHDVRRLAESDSTS